MFIDYYGNEFETTKEMKKFAKENFYEDEDVLTNALVGYFTLEMIIDWIVTEPMILKQFKEYFTQDLKVLEKDYVENYLSDCEEKE
jgi:hypothetical protein